jgi:hypothetical protein
MKDTQIDWREIKERQKDVHIPNVCKCCWNHTRITELLLAQERSKIVEETLDAVDAWTEHAQEPHVNREWIITRISNRT